MDMRESIYTVSGTKSIIPAILMKDNLLLWFRIHFHCLTFVFFYNDDDDDGFICLCFGYFFTSSYIYHSSFCDGFGLVPLLLFVFHQSIWFLIFVQKEKPSKYVYTNDMLSISFEMWLTILSFNNKYARFRSHRKYGMHANAGVYSFCVCCSLLSLFYKINFNQINVNYN